VTVPIKPAIPANTSLFQEWRKTKCATSRTESKVVITSENLTSRTSLGLGSKTIACPFLSPLGSTVRVSAFLIQSVMTVAHMLLFRSVLQRPSATHQKTVEQDLSFNWLNVVFSDHCNFSAPDKRNRRVV